MIILQKSPQPLEIAANGSSKIELFMVEEPHDVSTMYAAKLGHVRG